MKTKRNAEHDGNVSGLFEVMSPKAEALLLLARASEKRCQGGTYLLRVLSNYVTVGKDVGSGAIKRLNPRMSVAARAVKCKLDVDAFCRATTSEHPEPLNVVWRWLVTNAQSLNAADVIEHIGNYPMVTITKAEDAILNSPRLRDIGVPDERYSEARIVLWSHEPLRVARLPFAQTIKAQNRRGQ